MTEQHLSAEDYASVEHAERTLADQRSGRAHSLNQMVDAWRTLIEQVEQGYDLGPEEYANDLSCRDWLARALPLLTPRLRELRQAELSELDARFLAATVDLGGSGAAPEDGAGATEGAEPAEGERWWRRRRPRDPGRPASR